MDNAIVPLISYPHSPTPHPLPPTLIPQPLTPTSYPHPSYALPPTLIPLPLPPTFIPYPSLLPPSPSYSTAQPTMRIHTNMAVHRIKSHDFPKFLSSDKREYSGLGILRTCFFRCVLQCVVFFLLFSYEQTVHQLMQTHYLTTIVHDRK